MPAKGYTKRKSKWTRDEMLTAVRYWVETYGEVPASTDFHPGDARYCARISMARARRWLERASRFEDGVYPWPATVAKEFGSWSAFVKAAGFQPRQEAIPDISRALPRKDFGQLKQLSNAVVAAQGLSERRTALYELADRAMQLADTLEEEE